MCDLSKLGVIESRASNFQHTKSAEFSVLFMSFQYFSEDLAYYAPIMLILEPNFMHSASKISTSTEESVWLEALREVT